MKNFYKILFLMSLAFVSSSFAQVEDGFENRNPTENIWMQNGYNLREGEFAIGIGPLAYGINDQVQLETNVLLFLLQTINAKIKVNVHKNGKTSIASGLEYSRFKLPFLEGDSKLAFNTYSPFIALSHKTTDKTTFHISGKFSYFSTDINIDEFEAQSSSSGTEIMGGLDYSVSNRTKALLESGYDITYEGMRLGGGFLFGWETFRLKLGVSYFAPKNTDSYTSAVIGLWWRFKG